MNIVIKVGMFSLRALKGSCYELRDVAMTIYRVNQNPYEISEFFVKKLLPIFFFP